MFKWFKNFRDTYISKSIAWAFILVFSATVWVTADLTTYTESLLDTFLTAIDSDGDGSFTDEEWYTNLVAAFKAGDSYTLMTDAGTGNWKIYIDSTLVAEFTATGIDLGMLFADSTISSDGEFDVNDAYKAVAGTNLTSLDVIYYDTTATEHLLYDSDAALGTYADGIFIQAEDGGTSAVDGENIYYITEGVIVESTWTWTPGNDICVSTTAGALVDCDAGPRTSCADGQIYQVVGKAETATKVKFNFNQGWSECNGT